MSDPRKIFSDDLSRRGSTSLPLPTWIPASSSTGRIIANADFRDSPLGPIESWPKALTDAARICLESRFPFAIAWGSECAQLYNDAFTALCGKKHPLVLGQDMRRCWASAWSVLGPYFGLAQQGQGTFVEDARMFLDRTGALEEVFLSFSFSPLRSSDESDAAGVLLTAIENTGKMLGERRSRLLRDVVAVSTGAASTHEALATAVHVLEEARFDVPFAIVYGIDSSSSEAQLIESTHSVPDLCRPHQIELGAPATTSAWPIAEVVGSRRYRLLTSLDERFASLPGGPYDEPATSALLLPINLPGAHSPHAVLIAGISPRLVLDGDYMLFFERLASALSTSVAGARAHEEQRRRAEQLAALDRAKTAFFSNVSHEFRTPLTLLAGPLADELAETQAPLPTRRRQRIETAHRNTQRLIKLVNVLLDFSRIEAGRTLAQFRPTDLGTLTSELASMFRSTIERAGLELRVEVEPLGEPAFVDREMWEKIVLNLMSNAFKHTFEGRISVSLSATDSALELRVIDTGVGIAEHELPHLFERFHRVLGAQSRTHEGTGIGLALVRELSQLHGGDVRVESTLGKGTTFTVAIPRGSSHLPAEQIGLDATASPAGADVAAYVQEAAQIAAPNVVEISEPAEAREGKRRPRILLADDNADMRGYVSGLLSDRYQVAAVADGQAALELVSTFQPDLLLSDVMMPRLDGTGLLRALRADPKTKQLPVILLSARAGEEASVEGIEAGADDYLVKPFSARELLARVHTHVELSRARKEWADHLEQVNEELEAFSYSVSHDLRTPLRAIDGFSKAVLARKSDQLDDEAKQYLLRVRRAAGRMSELIDELLSLSRVARAPLERELVSLSETATRVSTTLRELHPERRVNVEVAPRVVVYADPRLLKIVLENLLENCWKFTARRGEAQVTIGVVEGTDPVTHFVADNGAGFDQAFAHRLFQPFQRLHLEQDYAGTGIGLAIVHRIISRHGGSIWAKGHLNQGATFYFTLSGKP